MKYTTSMLVVLSFIFISAVSNRQNLAGNISSDAVDALRNICKDKGPEDYHKTIDQYTKYMSQHPDDPDAVYRPGMTYYKLRDLASAIKMFDKSVSLKPTYGAAHLNRGICKYFSKDKIGACEDFKKSHYCPTKNSTKSPITCIC